MSAKPAKRSRKRAAQAAGATRFETDLTIHHAQAVHERLRAWAAEGAESIDASGVAECDSAGVQLLLAARRSAREAGRAWRLESPSAPVVEALQRYGLDENLEPRPRGVTP